MLIIWKRFVRPQFIITASAVAVLISVYAFAIYLIHNVILYAMRDNLYHEPTFGYFLLFFAVSFVSALGIALVVSRSRILARVLFLIRRKERKECDEGVSEE